MRHWFSLARVVSLAVFTSALLALAVTPSGASSNTFNVSKVGASFAIPTKWLHVPLDGSKISGLLKTAAKNNPQLKSALTQEVTEAAKKGISFFVFGPITENFAANVNIIVTSAAGEPTGSAYYDGLVSDLKKQLATEGFKDLSVAARQLPMGKEIEVTYTLASSTSAPPAQGLQLYVRHNNNVDIITFTSISQQTDIAAAKVLEDSWKWN
jgi:hypothetical protein